MTASAMTTVPKVKRALQEALKARVTVPVYRGYPPAEDPGDRLVLIGKARVANEHRALRGGAARVPMQESYTLDVVLHVYEVDGTQEEATDAAYGLLDSLQVLLAEEPTLGGLCQLAHVESWDEQEAPGPTGAYCLMTATVRVTARNR